VSCPSIARSGAEIIVAFGRLTAMRSFARRRSKIAVWSSHSSA